MEQEHFMRRALSLAKLGLGKVKTNPMVGCVIVKNNLVISEGYHKEFGQAHAEVNALKNLTGLELSGAEAFVTLEPCSHFGKTPPCADLLISSGLKKVSIAMLDPNPLVAGQGVKKLMKQGIDVHVGLLENEASQINAPFLHGIQQNTPYITLKWAESNDGFIAGTHGSEKISGSATDVLSHKFRTAVDAICVGSTTIAKDKPKLDTRLVSTDQKLKVSFGNSNHEGYIRLNPKSITEDLKSLYKKHHVGHLLVEGGSQTLQFFIDQDLFNQIRVIKSKSLKLLNGTEAPTILKTTLQKTEVIHTTTDLIDIYAPC